MRKFVSFGNALDSAKLFDLYEAAQDARDIVGPVEAVYEPLEVTLGANEHRLKDKYSQIEGRFEQFFRLHATSTASRTSDNSVLSKILYEEPSYASTASGNKIEQFIEPRDVEPFYGALVGEQVAVGQVPMRADGALAEVVQRRQRNMKWSTSSPEDISHGHLSTVASEQETGDDLAADLAGIGGYQADATMVEIPSAKVDAMELELTGLFSDTLSDAATERAPLEEEDLKRYPLFESNETLLLCMLPLEQDKTSSAGLNVFGNQQEALQEYLSYFDNTRDRVNRWMLHQLRMSRREVFNLQRTVFGSAPYVQGWASMVLQEWSNDALGQGQSYIHGSVEGDSSVSAAHHVISPHVVSMTQTYLDTHGDTRSQFP